MLTNSGSALVAPDGFGNSIASSRNQEHDLDAVEHVLEVVAQLPPDLVADLLRRAQRRDLAGPRARRAATRRCRSTGRRRAAPSVEVAPELALRDRGQRPLGVEVDRVAVDERQVLAR